MHSDGSQFSFSIFVKPDVKNLHLYLLKVIIKMNKPEIALPKSIANKNVHYLYIFYIIIIINKELLYIENRLWDAMSIRHQHSEKKDLFWVCLFFIHFFWLCPHLLPSLLVCCRREEQTSWSQLEENMSLNQVLSPCCWRTVAVCSVLPWSCSKHIPCRSCCKADCQNPTEQRGRRNISKHAGMVAFVYNHALYKKKRKINQKFLLLLFLQNSCAGSGPVFGTDDQVLCL